jgi:GNAT superfamily N-acetyltransferase
MISGRLHGFIPRKWAHFHDHIVKLHNIACQTFCHMHSQECMPLLCIAALQYSETLMHLCCYVHSILWHCSYDAICHHMAGVRLPSVKKHIWVVLRRSDLGSSSPPSKAELDALHMLEPATTHPQLQSPPLQLGAIQVVAMYALIPPTSPKVQGGPLIQGYQMVRSWLTRLLWVVPLVKYGLSVPFWSLLWMWELTMAGDRCKSSRIYDHRFHDLQVMCVARALQGQGVGTAVMRLIQDELKQTEEMYGMKGLCQSKETQAFYMKQGFKADAVYTHEYGQMKNGNARTHWLVAWHIPGRG